MTEDYRTLGHRLEPYIADTARVVWDTLDRDGLVVYEGAQGLCSTSITGPIPS